LQLPAHGHPAHTRSLTVGIAFEADGSWSARGDIIDLRKCSFVPMMEDLQTAGIIHQMSIDLRLDPGSRRIESIDTDQPFVAVEASDASRGECCRDPAPRLQERVGDVLDAQFAKRLSEVFGGPRGCSHLLTLFQLMASALLKALDCEAKDARRRPGEAIFRRAAFVDGAEIDEQTMGVAIQLADFMTRPLGVVSHPLERLALQHDARAYAQVARPTLKISELSAAQRERDCATIHSAQWQSLDAEVSGLVGSAVMGGLAGQMFSCFGARPERRLLLDCLLQLAPGYIQTMAAVMERWYVPSGRSMRMQSPDGEPSVGSVGGTPDSCYIWRSGGPMSAQRSDHDDF
jgi:hypothetical protein